MRQSGNSVRQNILKMLKESRGEWLSGEGMSDALGISRAAVSKHIRLLREQGHGIEAITRKGYRLVREAEDLSEENVLEGLGTTCFGRVGYVHLPSTASTNMEAMTLALKGAPEGSVVVADEQSGGRGRKGREWVSPAGGLYVSLVLRPDPEVITPESAPVFTLLTNVVIAEAIERVTGLTPVCKWPNDVLLDGRKVSGNLTETFLVADAVGHIVTGAGINVYTPPEAFPDNLRTPPTSLVAAAGRDDITRLELLKIYLERYEYWYTAVKNDGLRKIITRWKELTDVVGRNLTVEVRGAILRGTVTDVTDDGILVLVDGNGTEHRLFSGDILDG